MDQIMKEMRINDNQSFLSQKYNLNTGKLNARAMKANQN